MDKNELQARLYSGIDEIPTLPALVPRLLSMIEDDMIGAEEISGIISRDPAMTVKILKAANSAYYGFSQKISPDRYPYEYRVVEEREYLLPFASLDGSEWIDSRGKYQYRNLKFERRPVWVIELKQKDPLGMEWADWSFLTSNVDCMVIIPAKVF